ncbi:hypothetical protein LOD99_4087 [Oopsacas minuta]|uniref:Uncharacterized protein n=1 Tax=Oopsacas minuta TaxID=111878 RepID=A0AAV7JW82_9METZ|nr:hypothetical protein LOD99_4087 [Oopsacas minuta]
MTTHDAGGLKKKKLLSKSLTRMPHSNVPQNRGPRTWKPNSCPLSKIANGRVNYDLLREEASVNRITWPPARTFSSPLYSFLLPVGPKIGNSYWLQCLYCSSDLMMSKLNLMNLHFFGVGTSSCSRLEAFSAEHKTLFDELKEWYINGNLQLPKGTSKLAHGLLERDLVTSSTHTDSEESQFYSEALPDVCSSAITLSPVHEKKFFGIKCAIRHKEFLILDISKLSKDKHRSSYPFAVPGDLKVLTIRKLLVHFGVSIGISTRFAENFWFNKLVRKISPFTRNVSSSSLEQTTLPQFSTEARESLLFAIAKCPYITYECNGWTTMARNSLFCLLITGHKLDSEEQILLLYDQTAFKQQKHGAPEIYAFLKSAILKLKSDLHERALTTEVPKIIGIVADGEASVRVH